MVLECVLWNHRHTFRNHNLLQRSTTSEGTPVIRIIVTGSIPIIQGNRPGCGVSNRFQLRTIKKCMCCQSCYAVRYINTFQIGTIPECIGLNIVQTFRQIHLTQACASLKCSVANAFYATRNANTFQCSTAFKGTTAYSSQSIIQSNIRQGSTAIECIGTYTCNRFICIGFGEDHRYEGRIVPKCRICNSLNNQAIDLIRNLNTCVCAGISCDFTKSTIDILTDKIRNITCSRNIIIGNCFGAGCDSFLRHRHRFGGLSCLGILQRYRGLRLRLCRQKLCLQRSNISIVSSFQGRQRLVLQNLHIRQTGFRKLGIQRICVAFCQNIHLLQMVTAIYEISSKLRQFAPECNGLQIFAMGKSRFAHGRDRLRKRNCIHIVVFLEGAFCNLRNRQIINCGRKLQISALFFIFRHTGVSANGQGSIRKYRILEILILQNAGIYISHGCFRGRCKCRNGAVCYQHHHRKQH